MESRCPGRPGAGRGSRGRRCAGLYSTQLWLMTSASYAINVAVEGAQGVGRVVVPVSAVATKRLPMVPGSAGRSPGWVFF